jgi:hypothetical protein
MRAKYSKNFKDIPDIDVNTNIFKIGGVPIALKVPIFSPSFEYPQGALSQPTDITMIQIKQIGIPSLGVKTDGTVTPENTLTENFISTEVDPNKWGFTLASSAQNILYKTTVSKEPAGAVFIPVIAHN